MRRQDLTAEMNDPYGSFLFRSLDEVSSTTIELPVPTRIDLVSEISPDYLFYELLYNRLVFDLVVSTVDIFDNNLDIKMAETKSGRR